MKDKLFWEDAYKFEFNAKIVDIVEANDHNIGIILDGTYFFPEGGGQPSDRGLLGNAPVIDVQKVNDRIIHYIEQKAVAEGAIQRDLKISGQIDSEFRKQNMRAHTAAHLLFGAARKLFSNLSYAGFDIHGGGGSLYLETDSQVTPGLMLKMLEYANNIVVEERPIDTYIVEPEDVASIPGVVYNIKLPEKEVRIVEIEDWDVAVCGGTHLAKTIEVGPISIINRERHKRGTTRIDYVVAKSAVKELVSNEMILGELGITLSSSRDRIGKTAENLVNNIFYEQKRSKKLQETLAVFLFNNLIKDQEKINDLSLAIGTIPEVDQNILRSLIVKTLNNRQHLIITIVGKSGNTFLVIGQSKDIDLNLQSIIDNMIKLHGGSGGGTPHLLSAGGMVTSPGEVLSDLKKEIQTAIAEYK